MNLRLVKRAAMQAANVTGISSRLGESNWRRRRLLILAYHGVSLQDEHHWDPELFVSPEKLRSRFELLARRRCSVLPLAEAYERLLRDELPARSVVLTFDDGLADFALNVVPLLREFGFPATVYVTSYYLDKPMPVFGPALDYLLWKAESSGATAAVAAFVKECFALHASELSRSSLSSAIRAYTLESRLSAAQKHGILARVAASADLDFEAFVSSRVLQLMRYQELGGLPQDLVSVQLHTHRHVAPLDRESFEREIVENRGVLHQVLGHAALEHFCYPSGVFCRQHFEWLRALNVRTGTTCVPGLVSPRTNRWALPRFVDSMANDDETFLAWIDGFGALVPRRAAFRRRG